MKEPFPNAAYWRLLLALLSVLLAGRAVAQPGTVAFGNLVQLNGSTDVIQASGPAFFSTDNFTLEAYVRPAALPTTGFETIINNGFDNGTTGNGLALGIGGAGGTGGNKLLVLFSGLQFFDTGLTLPAANQWYHVAVTRRSGTTFAYLDGIQGPNTTTAAPNSPSGQFSVGSQNGIRFLNGQVDEARAWNTGRTQSQILSTANAPLSGNEAGLAVYWDMNRSGQGAGLTVQNKATSTGITLNGNTLGTAITPVFLSGTFGNAVTLDGTNDYIDLPANAAFQLSANATVEAWVKPTSLGAEKIVFINCVNPDNWGILLATSSSGFGEASVVIGASQLTLNGTTPLTTGVWTHLAAVRDGTTLRLYVNGVPDGTLTIPAGALRSSVGQSRIGKAQNGSTNLFGGSIDEVRVWSLARNETEIAVKLNSQLVGNEAGLVAYYDMNRNGQGAGLTASNKATATGTALDGSTVGTASTPVFTLANNFGINGSGALRVTGLSPVRNANTAATTANVALTFSQDVNAATAVNVRVISSQAGGRKAGTASVSGSGLTFDPSANFRTGEVLRVTVPATVQSQLGATAVPHVYQFTTAAGAGPGLFSKIAIVNVGTSLGKVAQADVDGDGDLDLLVADGTPHTVSIRLNNGNGSYGGSTAVNVGNGSADMVVADLDGDGDLDFATGNETANTVSVRMNDGNGNFSGSTTLNGFSEPRTLTAGDVDGDGDLDLVVANGVNSGSVSVRLNDGNGLSYTTAPTIGSLTFPIAPTLGDLDSDGDLDLVICSNLSGAAETYVRLNDGAGNFSGSGSIATGVANIDAALADFDGDGDLDLLTANIGSNTVSVRLNNGSGSFASGSTVTVGNRPGAIVIGDFDGDGDLDFVTANNVTPGSLSFRFNNGNGTFTGSANAISGNQPLSVATGDADGDGDLDVAMIEGAQTAIYLNQPAPSITSFSPTSGSPGALITLTGSGFLGTTSISFNGTQTVPVSVISGTSLTVLVPNGATSGTLTVTTGSGSGTSASSFTVVVPSLTVTAVSPARHAPAAARSSDVAVTFDQPVAAATAGNVRVFSNQTDGRLTGAATVSGNVLTFNPTADFKPGEVLRVSVPGSVLGTAGGAAVPHVYQFATTATAGPLTFSGTTSVMGTGPVAVAVGDVDGDGDLDLVAANTTSNNVSVRLNNGSGAFSNAPAVPTGTAPRAVALADLDGDGDLDLLFANSGGTGSVGIRLNNGSGSFSGSQNVAVGLGVLDVAVGDVDGDGDLDLVTADFNANTISIRLNSGSGIFGGAGSVSTGTGTGPFTVALADVDNDGDLDVLTANNTTGTVSLRLNDGSGTFTGSTSLTTGSGLRYFALGDVDGNGFVDIVASNSTGNTLTLNLNTSGTFATATTLATTTNPRSVALTDLDGDGDLDLLNVSQTASTVDLRLNNGSGSFGAVAALTSVGAGGQLVVPADLDGDGDLDLTVNNFTDNTVSIRLNQPAPVITSFSPGSGSAGAYVVLTGSNFLNMTGVSFNGTAAPGFVLNSATSVTVRVPAGATTGLITLTTGSGTATSATAFTVMPALNVLSRTPARHALAGGASSNVSVTFDQNLDPASLTAAPSTPVAMRVFGSELGGRRAGALTTSGATLSFDPSQNFRPGERVTVSLPGGVTRSTGGGTAAGQVWRFTAVVAGGSGSFSGGGDFALAAAAGTVQAVDVDGDGDLDLLTEDGTNNQILQLRNNGSGGFTAGPATAVNTGLQNFSTGDIDADGDIDLVTTNFSTSTVSVRFNDGSGNYTAGGYNLFYSPSVPSNAHLIDTDADGDLDLVALCDGSSASRGIYVTPNNGTGSFSGGSFISLSAFLPGVLEYGDADNDGDQDLLVSYTTNSGVIGGILLFRNNGAGTFDVGTNITTFTGFFKLEDVDADSDLDLLQITTFGSGSSSLLVSLNNGSGTFGSPASLSLGSTANPSDLALADVDADGDLDALIANSGANTVSVCVNNGTGTFATPVAVPVGSFPLGLATGDMDNDGDVDLLTASAGDGTVSLRLNQAPTAATISAFTPPSGTVGTSVSITGTNLAGTTSVSFNGTAATSFTVNSATSVTVVVPVGATMGIISLTTAANGTATTSTLSPGSFTVLAPQMQVTARSPLRHFNDAPLASNVALTFSSNVSAATAGNVRVFSLQAGGRKAGAAAVSSSVLTFNPSADFRPGEMLSVSVPATVLGTGGETAIPHVYQFRTATGSGGGGFGTPATLAVGTRPVGLALAELNGDGNLDLIIVNSNTTGTARFQMGNGNGGFGSPQILSLGNSPGELAVGDVDGDGDLDAVFGNSVGGTVSLAINASGTFSVAQTVNVGGEPNGVALADIDGDGDLDLLTVKRITNNVDIQQNDGNGIFTSLATVSTGSSTLPRDINMADIDNDGDLDLLTCNQSGSISILRNNGTGSFGSLSSVSTTGSSNFDLGDLDNDGDLDLAVSMVGTGIGIFSNAGGTFTAGSTLPTNNNPRSVALADIDGDGRLDALAPNADGLLSVHLNSGNGSFTPGTNVAIGQSSQRLTLADLNNDGILDLAVSNFSDDNVSIGLGQLPAATPIISSFAPTHAVVGTSITISGSNLGGMTAVSFNGTAATSFTINGAGTQVTVNVPAGATTGVITITTPAGAATSSSNFELDLLLNTTTTIPVGEYHDVAVAASTTTLGGDATINGTLTVQDGAAFADACHLVLGSGSFVLAAGATLTVCHDAGISASGSSGAVQVSGSRSFSDDANYIFSGNTTQATGNGLPARTRNLSSTNANELTLTSATSVAQVLGLTDGDLNLNGQALTLLSDATGTALAVNAGQGVVTGGTAAVQRYISPTLNAGRGYRHFSSPVSGETVGGLATGASPVIVNPAYNSSATPGNVTPFPTLFAYDQSRVPATGNTVAEFYRGWLSPNALTDPLGPMQGYTMQALGNETILFNGALRAGNQSQADLDHGTGPQAGWHLLGNPYPAPIDWSTLTTTNFTNMGSAVYVFQSTGQYNGNYRVYQAGLGDPIIASGQGFFVRSTATDAALRLTNANRLTQFTPNGAQLFRSTPDLRPQLHLALRTTGQAESDLTYIYFAPAATAAFDQQADAYKLRNPGRASLFSQLGNEELSINGLAPLTSLDVVVPLGLAVPAAGTYTLDATQLLNFVNTTVYLHDALTGSVINLSQQPAYSFSVAAGSLSSTTRFSVLFRPGTATTTRPGLDAAQIGLFPNPTQRYFTLLIPSVPAAKTISAQLINSLGQVVLTRTLPVSSTGVKAHFDVSGLAVGVYSLQLRVGGTAPITKRLIIQ